MYAHKNRRKIYKDQQLYDSHKVNTKRDLTKNFEELYKLSINKAAVEVIGKNRESMNFKSKPLEGS